jgi:hypothetical protein
VNLIDAIKSGRPFRLGGNGLKGAWKTAESLRGEFRSVTQAYTYSGKQSVDVVQDVGRPVCF